MKVLLGCVRVTGIVQLLVCFLMLLGSPSVASSETAIEKSAKQINDALERVTTCEHNAFVSIGVWPYSEADTPMDPDSAYLYYAQFISKLSEIKRDCVIYYSGDGVEANIDYLLKTDTFRQIGSSPLSKIEQNLQQVDFTLTGSLQEFDGKIYSIFKLVNRETGANVATTKPILVPSAYYKGRCGDGAASLDAALKTIANHVYLRAGELRELVLVGGYFGNSNAQTEFARFLVRQIGAEVSDAYWDPVSQRRIVIRDLKETDFERITRHRGVSVSKKQLRNAEFDGSVSSGELYRMKLRYWKCDSAIKLLVHFENSDGRVVAWRGGIRLDDIPMGLSLDPPVSQAKTEIGASTSAPTSLDFVMSSNRGDHPAFQPGEKLVVSLRFTKSAWLYCFYIDAEGSMTQLLPNEYQNRLDPNRNFYVEKVLHLFPDLQKEPVPDKFELTINDNTIGVEALHCLATSRDVTKELPKALRGESFEPVPPKYAGRLSHIFRQLTRVSIAEKQMTISVID